MSSSNAKTCSPPYCTGKKSGLRRSLPTRSSSAATCCATISSPVACFACSASGCSGTCVIGAAVCVPGDASQKTRWGVGGTAAARLPVHQQSPIVPLRRLFPHHLHHTPRQSWVAAWLLQRVPPPPPSTPLALDYPMWSQHPQLALPQPQPPQPVLVEFPRSPTPLCCSRQLVADALGACQGA